jgi:hypothetical protein
MLIHKWRDSDINQMPEVGQLGKYSIPKGYVNATQMCHANNKSWGHYKERKSTKAYWTALSNDIGIPISSLVIEVDGYGSSQGTWIHPEIAVDLASVGFCRVPHLGQQNFNESDDESRACTAAVNDSSSVTCCSSTTIGRARTAFTPTTTATD